MAIEIQILSGARQGERVVLDANEFTAGDNSLCTVFFNPETDPSVANRSATLHQTTEGWYIRSTGGGQILLNQSVVIRKTRIRSGDLVRMSKVGPDFSFNILSRATGNVVSSGAPAPLVSSESAKDQTDATATRSTADAPAVHLDSAIADSSTQPVEATASPAPPTPTRSAATPWQRFVLPGAGLAIVAAVVMLAVSMSTKFRDGDSADNSGSRASPKFEPITDQSVSEGNELSLELRVKMPSASDALPVFALVGQPPDGTQIDQQTGVFTWTPTEKQGPGQYSVHVQATDADNPQRSVESAFSVAVQEVNLAPVIEAIDEKSVKAGEVLTFSVNASDRDHPANPLSYRLENAPDWIAVDANSGIVRCVPPMTADGPYEATICVNDGDPRMEDTASIRIKVKGDPWVRAEHRLQEALFLAQVEVDGGTFPHATCCAIGDNTLLTTARQATDLANLNREGFRISVKCPVSETEADIRDIRVHRSYPDMANSDGGDWLFVNLGLLQTETKLPHAVELATVEELSELEDGLPVGCAGFPHDVTKITRFDKFVSRFTPAKVFGFEPPPKSSGPPVMEIIAKIPENSYGSPVLIRSGSVVAVYGYEADVKGINDLHYVTILDLPLLRAWLDGTGADDWVPPPAPHEANAGPPQQPSTESEGP